MRAAWWYRAVVASSMAVAGCDEGYDPGVSAGGESPAAVAAAADERPEPGTPCTVQFRRDLLGAARELPVSPTTNVINGAATSISGRFVRMDDRWIVVRQGGRGAVEGEVIWVPLDVVLLIQFGPH